MVVPSPKECSWLSPHRVHLPFSLDQSCPSFGITFPSFRVSPQTSQTVLPSCPSFVQVAATPSSFLGVCPVAGIVLSSFSEHLEHTLSSLPSVVHVLAKAVCHSPHWCPVAGMIVRSLMVVLQIEQYSLPL